MVRYLFFFTTLFLTSNTFSYEIGDKIVQTKSCKEQVQMKMSKDRQTVTLDFKKWGIPGGNSHPPVLRGVCDFAIPIRVPKGSTIKMKPIVLEGTYQLSAAEQVILKGELFWAGDGKGILFEKVFKGAQVKETRWTLPILEEKGDVLQSSCGSKGGILRFKVTYFYKIGGKSLTPKGEFFIDTADHSQPLKIEFNQMSCAT